MSLHSFQFDADAIRWSPTSWEARLLAGSLRGVAVTVLHGSDRANRDELLRRGVMPLLGRRLEDQIAPDRSGRVLPFPDRRGGGSSRQDGSTELVLLIDEWPAAPLEPLAERIRAAHQAATRPNGDGVCRVLLVLQDFETALTAASTALTPDPFWRELTDAVGGGATDTHLLLVTSSAATPALRWLARDLGGLGDHALQLGSAPSLAAPHLVAIPGLTPSEVPTPSPSDQDWLQGIDEALLRVAASARNGGEAAASDTALPIPADVPSSDPEPVADIPAVAAAAVAESPVAPLHAEQPRARRAVVVPALGVAAGIGVLLLAWSLRPREEPVTTALAPPVTAPAPRPTVPAAPAPAPVTISPEPGRTVLQALAPLSPLDLRSGQAQVAAELGLKGPPMLALVRYDALQGLPSTAALAGLRVVAPLFVEPVQVWVKADSPLRALQDLKPARLDVGLDGGDGLSAMGVRRALFGTDAPAAKLQHLANERAVPALLRGEVDAVLRARASPVSAAAQAAGPSLRLLTLDRSAASSSRALQDYLPVSMTGGQHTLGVMSFLVVRGGDSAAGDRLAGEAMRALCAASLPSMRPEIALPAGRPYAPAAEQAAASCRSAPTSTSQSPGESR